jgi:hypothetical protein
MILNNVPSNNTVDYEYLLTITTSTAAADTNNNHSNHVDNTDKNKNTNTNTNTSLYTGRVRGHVLCKAGRASLSLAGGKTYSVLFCMSISIN